MIERFRTRGERVPTVILGLSFVVYPRISVPQLSDPLNLINYSKSYSAWSALARLRHPAMSVLWPPSGEKRKWLRHRQTDAIDPNVWSGRALQVVSSSWR